MGGGTGPEQVQAARRKKFEVNIGPNDAKAYSKKAGRKIEPGKYTKDENGKLVLIDENLELDVD